VATARAATATLTRTVTVAAGAFAPGHLGELTRYVPFELADAVLEENDACEERACGLPSRVGVYLALALSLFPEVGYRGVWDKLTSGLSGHPVAAPTEKALGDLRRRIGVAPVKALFETLAGPLGQPGTPGVRFGPYRTVSFDGCTSQRLRNTGRIRAWLGKAVGAAFPNMELMALVETGTRGLHGVVFGPPSESETGYARQLLHLLDETMLVLWDRGFDSNTFMAEVAATGAQFLGRLRSNRRLPVLARLPDGSFLTVVGGLKLRVVEAAVTVTCEDGTCYTGTYRLATTLLDHRRYPAPKLVEIYHERWEHETAYRSLRQTVLGGRLLRSKDEFGAQQEVWALLALYQVLCTVIVDAAESQPGTDPDRASFKVAFEAARAQVSAAAGVPADTGLVGHVGRQVLAKLLPPRRFRVVTRKVKSPLSRYPKSTDGRPVTSQAVTRLEIVICVPVGPPEPPSGSSTTPPDTDVKSPQGDASQLRLRQPRREKKPGRVLTGAAGP
jgi:hypothetical protein